jgi:hypothetical protein
MLRAAQAEGLEAQGLDFAPAMVEYVRERFGIQVEMLSLEDLAAQGRPPFEVIVLNAVLEHVYDPDAMVDAARRLTRPGSLLYINIPVEPHLLSTVGNFVNKLRRDPAVFDLSPTWPPYHVFGFNRRALRTLLDKHSFAITDVRVRANAHVPARDELRDQIKAFVGTQISRIANLTGTASDMCVWARRH